MKQFAVIGLGSFGYYLATHLYENGHEVLAIDKAPGPVQEIRDQVTQAVVADATDRKAMESLGIFHMDAAVVCIGTDMSQSILATLNLKEMGCGRVIAKAMNNAHGRILKKMGAAEVLFPEKDLAVSLAKRLHNPNMLDYLPFTEGYSIVELVTPKVFAARPCTNWTLSTGLGCRWSPSRRRPRTD